MLHNSSVLVMNKSDFSQADGRRISDRASSPCEGWYPRIWPHERENTGCGSAVTEDTKLTFSTGILECHSCSNARVDSKDDCWRKVS